MLPVIPRLLVIFLSVVVSAHAAPPNIIFILADDLGYGELGCYGQKLIQTPNLDRLAAGGTRFTQVYAGSCVCAPSRCCLMTGMHNGHARIRDNVPHGTFLKNADITMAEVLHEAGYRTGAVGKWSLGIHGSEGKPNDQGFDDFYGHVDQDQAHFYYPDHLWDNDRVVLLPGNRGEKKQQYTADLFAERALKFIRDSAEQPFFLFYASTLPHWSDYPLKSDESQIVPSDAPYTDRDWPQVEKNYAAMVTMLDRDVGRLMDLLDESGLANDTLIFFSSDNGPSAEAKHKPAFFGSAGALRGVKRDVYEGGIRVPMLVRWPGHVPAGKVSDEVWTQWDVMPTLAEIVGAKITHPIDGHSILTALKGGKAPPHDYLYWDYGHSRGQYKQAARKGDWKAVRNGTDQPIELYDIRYDQTEIQDVAAKHPDVVAQMEEILATASTPDPAYPIAPPKAVRKK
ncbi:MAG TPA: N-acetylgalactosamine 6-sulfate sulfatase [Verrucomicrobiales bacterium]|nr:N-acetylgalactosamine 6-sulfate sulfatase [Verrucomicrobiales bacterium]